MACVRVSRYFHVWPFHGSFLLCFATFASDGRVSLTVPCSGIRHSACGYFPGRTAYTSCHGWHSHRSSLHCVDYEMGQVSWVMRRGILSHLVLLVLVGALPGKLSAANAGAA